MIQSPKRKLKRCGYAGELFSLAELAALEPDKPGEGIVWFAALSKPKKNDHTEMKEILSKFAGLS